MKAFNESLWVDAVGNAAFFAADLFYESFRVAFPVPRDNCGLAIPTPPHNWRQYVALYQWDDARMETVGFCNWIKFDEVYLEGGMCVKKNFYRRLPTSHWEACRERGGIAQIMMETAARDLTDCAAWFGYCGDRKASIVDARVGYVPTKYRYLIVKWFTGLARPERERLIDKVGAIGPF